MSVLLFVFIVACAPTDDEDFSRPTGPVGVTDGPSDGSEDDDTGDTGIAD